MMGSLEEELGRVRERGKVLMWDWLCQPSHLGLPASDLALRSLPEEVLPTVLLRHPRER